MHLRSIRPVSRKPNPQDVSGQTPWILDERSDDLEEALTAADRRWNEDDLPDRRSWPRGPFHCRSIKFYHMILEAFAWHAVDPNSGRVESFSRELSTAKKPVAPAASMRNEPRLPRKFYNLPRLRNLAERIDPCRGNFSRKCLFRLSKARIPLYELRSFVLLGAYGVEREGVSWGWESILHALCSILFRDDGKSC